MENKNPSLGDLLREQLEDMQPAQRHEAQAPAMKEHYDGVLNIRAVLNGLEGAATFAEGTKKNLLQNFAMDLRAGLRHYEETLRYVRRLEEHGAEQRNSICELAEDLDQAKTAREADKQIFRETLGATVNERNKAQILAEELQEEIVQLKKDLRVSRNLGDIRLEFLTNKGNENLALRQRIDVMDASWLKLHQKFERLRKAHRRLKAQK